MMNKWDLDLLLTIIVALAELDRIEKWIEHGAKGVYQVGEG